MALLAALTLCLTTPLLLSKSDDATTIQVTDNRGRTIEVLYPCERIIFLVENAVNNNWMTTFHLCILQTNGNRSKNA